VAAFPILAAVAIAAAIPLVLWRFRTRDGGAGTRGPGLLSRLALFPILLTLAVIAGVSVPLYAWTLGIRREALLKNLWDRSSVLLDALSASAGIYLAEKNEARLSALPSRMEAIPEARHVTVTGGSGPGVFRTDVLWATNDPDLRRRIKRGELGFGVSRLDDPLSRRLEREGPEAGRGALQSEPEFVFRNVAYGDGLFVFYRSFVYLGPYGSRSMGFVRMGVRTGSIMEAVFYERSLLRRRLALAALGAFALATAGILVYSSENTVRVRRLVSHAGLVLRSADERTLQRAEIKISGRDEIAVLGNILNSIAQRMAQSAATLAGLSAGRKLQRKLLPLDADPGGSDFGLRESDEAVFFAYYEEANEISGDYFDYRNLDDRYYAVIKCDVAGSGPPAALISMQISTMFRNYFRAEWEPGRIGRMEDFVYLINSFIAEIGASRRFAAFTLCVFDSKTGDVHFCNAGDSTVRVYDSRAGRVVSIPLPETPAAGILPYNMVVSKGGYRVQTISLDVGDILFMYTDGLEESRRKYRGPVFDGKPCVGVANRIPHGNHVAGQWGEELGGGRIYAIIDAAMNRGTYRLRKWHTAEGGNEFLHFDFSDCRGGVRDAIMALVAVEKMFRCYREPVPSRDDRVPVRKKVDDFLRAHFLEYDAYCGRRAECPDDPSRLYYTFLKEDYRNDDLAVIGIERKKTDRGETNDL